MKFDLSQFAEVDTASLIDVTGGYFSTSGKDMGDIDLPDSYTKTNGSEYGYNSDGSAKTPPRYSIDYTLSNAAGLLVYRDANGVPVILKQDQIDRTDDPYVKKVLTEYQGYTRLSSAYNSMYTAGSEQAYHQNELNLAFERQGWTVSVREDAVAGNGIHEKYTVYTVASPEGYVVSKYVDVNNDGKIDYKAYRY